MSKRKHEEIETRNEILSEKVNNLEKTVGGILLRLNNIGRVSGNTLENYILVSTNSIYTIKNYLSGIINNINRITDKLVTTKTNQDGTIHRTKLDGSTTITANGNTTTFGPEENKTIGNRLGNVETSLQSLETEIEGTDGVVNDLGTRVHLLQENIETFRQDLNRIALDTGRGGSRQERKTND